MEVKCDGKHQHIPYGYKDGHFATSEEAEYPDLFCQRMADCVHAQLNADEDMKTWIVSLHVLGRQRQFVHKPIKYQWNLRIAQ